MSKERNPEKKTRNITTESTLLYLRDAGYAFTAPFLLMGSIGLDAAVIHGDYKVNLTKGIGLGLLNVAAILTTGRAVSGIQRGVH